jgi:hypothetical protein
MTKKILSLTPILDDEETKSYHEVRDLWFERQPECKKNVTWLTCKQEVRNRFHADKEKQIIIRDLNRWNALPLARKREYIESVNRTVDAINAMTEVLDNLKSKIPVEIDDMACKYL